MFIVFMCELILNLDFNSSSRLNSVVRLKNRRDFPNRIQDSTGYSSNQNKEKKYGVNLLNASVWSILHQNGARDFDCNWQHVKAFSHCVTLTRVLLPQIISYLEVNNCSSVIWGNCGKSKHFVLEPRNIPRGVVPRDIQRSQTKCLDFSQCPKSTDAKFLTSFITVNFLLI